MTVSQLMTKLRGLQKQGCKNKAAKTRLQKQGCGKLQVHIIAHDNSPGESHGQRQKYATGRRKLYQRQRAGRSK